MTSAPGPLLARGRDADVFALDAGRVLRRYRSGADATPEANLMRHVAAHGIRVPVVHDAAGPDLVLERLTGPTMRGDLAAHPWRLAGHARTLAGLHRGLGAVPAPAGLPAA